MGQAWREGQYELKATLNTMYANSAWVGFKLTSRKPALVSTRYSLSDGVLAVDNRGNKLRAGYYEDGGECAEDIVTLNPGDSIDLLCKTPGYSGYNSSQYQISVWFDATDPSITEVVLTFSGFFDIENARWRIPVYH
jgi:hypothetical protein